MTIGNSLYRAVRPTVKKQVDKFRTNWVYPSRANRNWQIFHFMSRLLWVSSQEDIYCGVKWKRCGVGRGSWEGRKYEASGTGHSFYILGLGNQTLTVSRVEKVDELKSKVETNGRWVPLQIKTFILLFCFEKNWFLMYIIIVWCLFEMVVLGS